MSDGAISLEYEVNATFFVLLRQRSLRQTEPIDSGGKFSDHHVKTWYRERMVLMEDSACAFLPTAGVGASMVLESAAVLAYELSRADLKFIERSLYS